jgi:hypothetical protein
MKTVTIECWDISGNRWRPVGTAISHMRAQHYINEQKAKGLQARYRVTRDGIVLAAPSMRRAQA